MFWESWESIVRIVIVAVLIYIALVAMLRVSGKRTLSKMNMFDFIITIALGSTFATIIVSEEVSFAEGLAAAGTLIFSQFVVTNLSTRSQWFRNLVKGEPALLYYNHQYMEKTMMKERVSKEEVHQAMRKSGLLKLDQVFAVVLETDGTMTAIPNTDQLPEAFRSTSLQSVPLEKVAQGNRQ